MTAPSLTIRRPSAIGSLLERVAWRVALSGARRIRFGRLTVVLPDGTRRVFGDAAAASEDQAQIEIHDREALVRLLVGGETGGGEAYMDGLWSSPDLAALLRLAARNRESLALSTGWFRVPLQIRRTLAHRTRRNTQRGARRNIAAHYDLGNDFYRLFLDETLTYSCAFFETPDQTLADAQRNKYRRIAEGAGLSAGQHVLEIGSGWGGFALYAAGELGCRVTTITISREQHALATREGSRSGTRAPRRRPAARLPRRRWNVRRDCFDRNARGRRGGVSRDVLRDLRSGTAARWTSEPPGDHLSRRRLRAAAARGELDPDVHLSGRPVPIPRSARAGNQPDAAARPECRRTSRPRTC